VSPASPAGPSSAGAPSSGGAGAGGAPSSSAPSRTVAPKAPPPPPRLRQVRKDYTYVIDVEFGQTGNERTRKGVRRLRILPSDRNPVVVFLGVSSDLERAVFLIDSRVSQSGEGACRPSVKSCTFLYLRERDDRDEQFLTDDQGREYHLKLLDIRRVEVKRSAKKGARSSARATGAGGARELHRPELAPDVRR